MAVLIVSVVLVASLGTFGAIGRSRQAQVDRAQAFGLAELVMAEVVQSRFAEPSGAATTLGADAGEHGRADYDDVDDFNGWAASPPSARDGTPLPGYAGWSVTVWVRYVAPDDLNAYGTPAGLKRVQVRVVTPAGVRHEMYALRAAGGAYEEAPAATVNYLTGGGVAVKVGERGRTVYGGAHPLNVTTSQ